MKRKSGPGALAHLGSAWDSETILLVSRDADTRMLVRSVFFHRGYLVLEAADEQHAAFVWRQMEGKIDLIIVDASPSQICSWGRWHQRTPKLFILLQPADTRLNTAPTDAETEYLMKPFTAEEIALKVRLVLDCHKEQTSCLNCR